MTLISVTGAHCAHQGHGLAWSLCELSASR
jgi:hypothetical protein